MGMTMTQKILAAHAGLDKVEAGQLIEADLDLVLGNDITSPVAIKEMSKMKVDGVFDKDRSHLFRIILYRIKILNLLSIVNASESLLIVTRLPIILKSDRWVLSMHFCRKKV